MNMTIERDGQKKAAVAHSSVYLENVQDALDLMATASHLHKCNNLLLRREQISPDFFDLKTGLAGEILQKFVNYGTRIAIVGDFSDLTAKSKSLHDFIYESNKGNHVFFLRTQEEALHTLWHRGEPGSSTSSLTLVCYDKCSTCKKARTWLDTHGIAYISRPIKEENPQEMELRMWHARSGLPLKRFFNTSGNLYKEQGLKDKLPQMGTDEQLALLATDGMLVKRPLLVSDDFVLVGFKEEEWAEKLL